MKNEMDGGFSECKAEGVLLAEKDSCKAAVSVPMRRSFWFFQNDLASKVWTERLQAKVSDER
jgi:hypothetical protein